MSTNTGVCVCTYMHVCSVAAVWRPILDEYRWYLVSCWSVDICVYGGIIQVWIWRWCL